MFDPKGNLGILGHVLVLDKRVTDLRFIGAGQAITIIDNNDTRKKIAMCEVVSVRQIENNFYVINARLLTSDPLLLPEKLSLPAVGEMMEIQVIDYGDVFFFVFPPADAQ